MRIDSNANLRAATEQAGATSARPAPANTSGGELLAPDRAELSPDQARVQSLSAQVNALPEIRRDKVAALQVAVKQGNYEVSAEQTAEAMMSEMLVPHSTAA